VADVISGQITMNFSSLPPAVSQIKGGNQGPGRDRQQARESRCPTCRRSRKTGHRRRCDQLAGPCIFAPAKTPDAILDKIESPRRRR